MFFGNGELACGRVDKRIERVADHGGLFVYFFEHEMVILTLARVQIVLLADADFTFYGLIVIHVDIRAFACDGYAITIFEEANALGERGKGVRI